MKSIVLTGGGTGGHVIPNVSLLPLLRQHFDKIYYIGSNGIEKDIISKEKDVTFFTISACKLDRTHLFKNLALPFKLLKSKRQAKYILKNLSPDVIFSKGGYVSVPVCLASHALGIPIVSHESDLSLGVANKLISKVSLTVCTTFEKTAKNLKNGVYTGAPIRQELRNGSKDKGYKMTGFNGTRPIILFTGGSTGAKAINDAVISSLSALTSKYDVIHLCGKGKGNNLSHPHYIQMEYCYEIQHLFKIADIVVSRAGSGAIYELLSLNKKMILIPLPKGNSRGDQVENAKYFEEKGYASVIDQEKLNTTTLMDTIDNILNKQNAISPLVTSEEPYGAQNIVNEILKAIKE